MTQQKSFRSALNGFNREDVVHYIEYINAKHASEVNQLKSELELLRAKLAAAETAAAKDPHILEQLKDAQMRCENLEGELKEAREAAERAEARCCAALEAQTAAEAEKLTAVQSRLLAEAQRDAVQRQNEAQNRMEQELEAYRRAERTERLARERAEQVYHRVNGVLADATVKVDDAATRIGELTDLVSGQLAQLQDAVAGSKQALQEASSGLYTIRPTADGE